MFLKRLILMFGFLGLFGCVQSYVVSSSLSKAYIKDRDLYSDKYADLRVGGIVFYIETGFFYKDRNKLVVFLKYDSPAQGRIFLTKSEILLNQRVFSTTSNFKHQSERPEEVNPESVTPSPEDCG